MEALGKAGARPRDVAAIGITNQRETVIVWDRATGKPISSGHRLARPAHRRLAATLEDRGVGEAVSSDNRPGPRSLFLRHQSQLDSR